MLLKHLEISFLCNIDYLKEENTYTAIVFMISVFVRQCIKRLGMWKRAGTVTNLTVLCVCRLMANRA